MPSALTTEIGAPFRTGGQSSLGTNWAGVGGDTSKDALDVMHDRADEFAAACRWPKWGETSERMRADSQVSGLTTGMLMPIRRYYYGLDAEGCDEEQVQQFADDMSLPIVGKDAKKTVKRAVRTAGKISFDDFLAHILLGAGFYGTMAFEKVYRRMPDSFYMGLRKLSPRMPSSWTNVIVNKQDGGLEGIRQLGVEEPIPVSSLVVFPFQKEGANWYGRPLIRPLYGPWYFKDKLQRIDLVKHDRNGAGIPTAVGTDPDVTKSAMLEAQRIAMSWRVGNISSAALPPGTDIILKAVEGQLPNTLDSIKYYDEAMARGLMMMVASLGSSATGSRALGETFADLATIVQESIAEWAVKIINQYVIEPYWDLNFGPSSIAPVLIHKREFANEYSVADLQQLFTAKALTPDPELEAWLREQGGLPEQNPKFKIKPGAEIAKAIAQGGGLNVAPNTQGDSGPPQPGQQKTDPQGNPIAAAAGTPDQPLDTQGTQETWEKTLAEVIAAYLAYKAATADDVQDDVTKAGGSIAKLGTITVGPTGDFAKSVAKAMSAISADGARRATQELRDQGFTQSISIDTAPIKDMIRERAPYVEKAIGSGIVGKAVSVAVANTSKTRTPEEVADLVRSYVASLSTASAERELRAALIAAQNQGRFAALEAAEVVAIPGTLTFVASEQMDLHTCGPCADVNGREYATVADARLDYPVGGFSGCEGEENCRGTVAGKVTKS